jgi:hypothetical protein
MERNLTVRKLTGDYYGAEIERFVRAYLLRFACDPRELLVASRFPVWRRGLPSIIITTTTPPGVARGAISEKYHLVSCMFWAMVPILHLWHEILVPSCVCVSINLPKFFLKNSLHFVN